MSKEMIVSCSSQETKLAILEDDQVTELYFERGNEYSLAGSICKGRVTRVLPGMQSAFVDIGLERDAFLYVSDFLEDLEEYDRIASTVEEKVIRMDESVGGKPTAAAPVITAPSPGTAAEPGTPGESSAWTAGPGDSKLERAPLEKAPQEKINRAEPPRASAPEKASPPAEPYQRPSAPPGTAPRTEGRPEPGEGRYSRRSRRRRPHHKGFPDSKYAKQPGPASTAPSPSAPSPSAPPPSFTPIILPGESLAKYKDWPRAQAPQPQTEATERMAETQPADFPSPPPSPPSVAAAATELEYAKEERPEALPSRSLAVAPSLTEQVEPAPHAPEASIAPLAPRQELAEGRLQPEIEEPASPPDLSSAEASPSAAPESAEPAIEASPEGGEPESAVLKAEPVEQGTGESGATQKATVRERSRNPRYMRRGRWMARKEGQTEAAPRGSRPKDRETPQPLIADLLKEGQEILVQVAKEPLGKKGARITSHIALPGRYLVYMPTVDHIGVSRKIASDEERQRLKRIILEHSSDIPGGFIVRTAGEGHSEEDFRQDIFYLSRLWAETRAQAEKVSAPALLHHDLNLVLRILRDQLSDEFSAVWVDNEQEYESILSLVSKFQPGLVNRVKLYTKDVPLFDELGINEEITKALKPKVWLKSGGYIVINQTEALVAIDVNTGKFVGKSNRLEDTIVKTNVDAIREIVRQIRLRDLGGIIVVDFIDMDEKKNRQKVMAAMEEALKSDRSPSKLLSFNEFGLVAITRKRVRQSLERTLCQACAYCGGSGLVKSVITICNEILSEARKLASQLERKQITLRVNPDVGKALKLRGNTILQEIEEITGKTVIIRNDPSLHMENFDFN